MSGKELFLVRAEDGSCFLYGYLANLDVFKKIASAKDGWYVEDNHQYVILDNGDEQITLYGINEGVVFNAKLPKNAQVELDGGLCIYQYNGLWRTREFIGGHWRRFVLGSRANKAMGWSYYLQKKGDFKVELRFIVNDNVISAGIYNDVIYSTTFNLVALRKDGRYDMFVKSDHPKVTGDKRWAYQTSESLMIWDDKAKGWCRFFGCKLWAKNAIYALKVTKTSSFMELYEYCDGKIRLVNKGAWKWEDRKNKLCVDGIIYSKNSQTGEVDFANYKLNFRSRLKRFFSHVF